MVLEGPLIHHLEVSEQGFVLAVLPFGKIQTKFCISWPTLHVPFKTIWGINTVHSYFTIQNHNSEWFQMVHQLVWKKGTKSRRVKYYLFGSCVEWKLFSLPVIYMYCNQLLVFDKLNKYAINTIKSIIPLIYLFLGRPFSETLFLKVPRKPVNKGVCYVNQKHRGKPLLFHDKCSGFFYVHYFNNLVHGTYGLTSHPKDKAIMVKCPSQGHKRRHQPGWDSNPHSDKTRTTPKWS